jgi:MFS family permease
LVSTIGTWMQMLAQAWVVLELTDSAAALGLTVALQTLPVLTVGAYGGVLADRFDNVRLLRVTNTAGMAQALALGVLQATGHLTVHWVWAFAVVLGVITAFDRPAMQAILYELVGPDDLPSAVGISSTINSGGRLVGPGLAGLLIAVAGLGSCFAANAVSFAAVLVALARLDHAAMQPRRRSTGGTGGLRDGLAYAWRDPVLRIGLGTMFVVGVFAYNFATTVPSMVRFVFHAGAGSLGVVQAVSGIGAVAAGLVVAGLRRPSCRLLGAAGVVFGTTVAAAAIAPTLVVFGLVMLPLGMASACFSTVVQMVLQHNAAPEYQGRVMSLFTIAWLGTTPIGGLIVGPLIDASSARVALVVGAAATVLAGLVALAVNRTTDTFAEAPAVPEVLVDAEEAAAGT